MSNKISTKFAQAFRDTMYADALTDSSADDRRDFWSRYYIQRLTERERFRTYASSETVHLARVSGPIGCGKTTFILEKFENPIFDAGGAFLHLDCMDSILHASLEKADRWKEEFRRQICRFACDHLFERLATQGSDLGTYAASIPEDLSPRVRRSIDARIAASIMLTSENAVLSSRANRFLSTVDFSHTPSWTDQRDALAEILISNDDKSDIDMISNLLGSTVAATWLRAVALTAKERKVFLFVDNVDNLPYRHVHQQLLGYLKLLVGTSGRRSSRRSGAATSVPVIKCILAIRDENIPPTHDYGGRTTRSTSFEMRGTPLNRTPIGERVQLDTTGEWIAEILQKRAQLFEERATSHEKHWKLWASLCSRIIDDIWAPLFRSDTESPEAARLGGSLLRASNFSIRLALELVVTGTLDWLDEYGTDSEKIDLLLRSSSSVHRGRVLRTLTLGAAEYEDFLTAWRAECDQTLSSERPCSAIRMTLAFLQSRASARRRVRVHQILSAHETMLGIDHELTLDALFALYVGPARLGEFISIFQSRWISDPDDIEPDAHVTITHRGSEVVTSYMHTIDLWGWLARERTQSHLFEMDPRRAERYTRRIWTHIAKVSTHHWHSWSRYVAPRIVSSAAQFPFQAFRKEYDAGHGCFFMERTANVHAHLLETYIDAALGGFPNRGILVCKPTYRWPRVRTGKDRSIVSDNERREFIESARACAPQFAEYLDRLAFQANRYRKLESLWARVREFSQDTLVRSQNDIDSEMYTLAGTEED